MALDEVEQLPELVGLGLSAACLKVEALARSGMAEDVVAALDPVELEPKRLSQALGVDESDVGQLAPRQPPEQGARLHSYAVRRRRQRPPRLGPAATSISRSIEGMSEVGTLRSSCPAVAGSRPAPARYRQA